MKTWASVVCGADVCLRGKSQCPSVSGVAGDPISKANVLINEERTFPNAHPEDF